MNALQLIDERLKIIQEQAIESYAWAEGPREGFDLWWPQEKMYAYRTQVAAYQADEAVKKRVRQYLDEHRTYWTLGLNSANLSAGDFSYAISGWRKLCHAILAETGKERLPDHELRLTWDVIAERIYAGNSGEEN